MSHLTMDHSSSAVPSVAESSRSSASGIGLLDLDHSDRLVQAMLRLGQLRSLQSDWNSYGSPPPDERLIRFAEMFVVMADDTFRPFLPTPQVVPLPGGGISLSWTVGVREIELEFEFVDSDQIEIAFLRVSHDEPIDEGLVPSVGGAQEHLLWVMQG